MSLPRGIRNKNPGNIRWGSNWQGLVDQQDRTDKDFCQFKSHIYGLRALVKVLFTYRDKYGIKTIAGIINRYAPPIENNTAGYIDRVCTSLNVSPNDPVKLTDDVLLILVRAITAVENGNMYYAYYENSAIYRAIELARS